MEQRLIYLTAVLALALAAQWLSWRLRLPAIVLLLLFGFAAGCRFGDPEELIDPELLFPVVSLAVAVILFEGGLSLRLRELRETGRTVLALVTIGLAVTWVLTAAAARLLLGFEPAMAALLGAILVVSGPTVIMPLLRQIRPSRRVGSIVKWEGIVNDPIGAVLAFIVLYGITIGGFEKPLLGTLGSLVVFLLVGGAIGLATAMLLVQLLRRYWIPDYLQNTAFLTAVVLAYVLSNYVRGESGLIAVTLFGVILANQKVATVKHVIEFKENLRVLLISCLFIVLASRLKLNDLLAVGPGGLLFLAVLLFVVRPVSVFLATLGRKLELRERLFLAWMHPRGIVAAAVASVFALELSHGAALPPGVQLSPAVLANAELLVPLTFLVIVGTVTIYGLTAGPLARWLKIAESDPQGILFAGASQLVREIAAPLAEEGYQVLLVDTNQRNIATARMAGLDTCWANICSEYAREELDLGGIGRLLAMTPNDEVNTLATAEFAELFGRSEVYQLPYKPVQLDSHTRLSPQRNGRMLFGDKANYTRLLRRLHAGAVVKKTGLTDEFDFAAFNELYGESAIVLFAIDPSGKLTVCTRDTPVTPQPGQTLISLVDPAA